MSIADTVLDLDRIRRDAMTKADVATLGDLFADDMVWIHATARVDTKAGLLDAIGSGSTKYLSIEVSQETVRDFGDVVLVGGIAAMTAEIKGETRELRNRFTIVWARRGDAWQVVNWQSTSVRA
jgi:ketosteroid isomerase-like protein